MVHRVVAVEDNGERFIFVTRGDNVDSSDPPITEQQVVGKVVLVLPKVGYISVWFRQALDYLQIM